MTARLWATLLTTAALLLAAPVVFGALTTGSPAMRHRADVFQLTIAVRQPAATPTEETP